MRELQEYKAEIFRRSEIRIARRKKRRRRAGILCIACMLCGTFALLFQRTAFPTEKTVIRAFEEQLQESAADSADVLVMSRPLKESAADSADVLGMSRPLNEMDISERELSETATGEILQALLQLCPAIEQRTIFGQETALTQQMEEDPVAGYLFLFETDSGEEQTYSLQGQVLCSTQADACATLTDAQRRAYMSILENGADRKE